MNSSAYNLEVHRKSYQFEPNCDQSFEENKRTKLKSESDEKNRETLLADYEIVNNEELVEEEEAGNKVGHHVQFATTSNVPHNYNYKCNGKLHLNLNAGKISLKSQTTAAAAARINKSIAHNDSEGKQRAEKETTVLNQPYKRGPLTPIAFSIVPINLENKFAQNKDIASSNNYPEILLTSFKTRTSNAKAKTLLSNGVVTDQFQKALATHAVQQQRQRQQGEQPHFSHAIIPLPPPPEVVKRRSRSNSLIEKFKTLPAVKQEEEEESISEEVCDKLCGIEDCSEINSSTSPESLMDNILSAASSTSVRSSSLSSTNTDMAVTQLGACANTYAVAAAAGATSGGGANDVSSMPVSKETHANRSLNLKSGELKVTLPIFLQPSPSPTVLSQLNETQALLQPPELYETSSVRSRSPSPIQSIAIRITPDLTVFPEELKCLICADVFRDPRTLNCLHSFCFQCVVNENFKEDTSIPFWSQPNEDEEQEWKSSSKQSHSLRSASPEISMHSVSEAPSSPSRPRRSSFSFRRKKSVERILVKAKTSDGKSSSDSSSTYRLSNTPPQGNAEDKLRIITCKICKFNTELPTGGIRQLPQNYVLVRKIEELKLKLGDEVISQVWCSLCYEETSATYHCITCTLNLCTLCKDAHGRQRNTSNHRLNNITELRKARNHKQNMLGDNTKFTLKCSMHPGFEMKSFCTHCLQIACPDCLVLLHKGHKYEPISKAISTYSKLLRDSADQTRPLCNYAEHSIERLNDIAKGINRKCDAVQADVERFMSRYFEALEVHRKTLIQQLHRARESKVEIILEQQLELEKRTNEAMEAVRFSQELSEIASDVEILSFVNILLKRFEYCQQFKTPIDPKISDSLHFLPKIRAPSTKTQNDIPLFGIITMQTVDATLCTLQWEGFSQLRLHKKVELIMMSRDADGVPLCHGGLQINAIIKYKEYNTKFLPLEISDHRDGTYCIAFTPDSQGTILLTVTINDKPIKGSPFTFLARTVRPHHGIFHCCTFCSSKGNKSVKCSCEGRMPGYNGCGHGHVGHPGRRHWSCCGNVLENSECNVANKLLNA